MCAVFNITIVILKTKLRFTSSEVIDYLVDPDVDFRESLNAAVVHRPKRPESPGLGRSL